MYFTACGGGESSGDTARVIVSPIIDDPSNPGGPVTSSLTYYSLSKTVAPIGGWPAKTYTAKGSCVVYLTKTYCWDDGIKSVVIPASGTFTYTYFSAGMSSGVYQHCSGGCLQDYMLVPKFISAALEMNLTFNQINQVFTSGVAHPVECSEENGILNCVDFQIDLNQ